MLRVFVICLMLFTFVACTSSAQQGVTKTVVVREATNELEKDPVPGTQSDVWVEPMYEQVRVPAAIDPHGVYYRPSHNTLIEVRPGKYQRVQYPDYDGNYQRK